MFDDFPVALFRSLPDGTLIAVNKAFRELTGYGDDTVLRKLRNFDLYANPDERHEKLSRLFSQGFLRNEPWVVRCFDGSVKNTFLSVNLVCNADGEALSLEGAVHEAEEEKWSKNQLEYRLALEALAADLSAHLIGIAHENRKREITTDLSRLAGLTGDERVHIDMIAPGTLLIKEVYEWAKDGLVSFSEILPPDLYVRNLPWVMSVLRKNQVVHLADCVRDTPPDAVLDIAWWQEKNRRSSLFIPIFINDQLAGIFGCHNDTINKTWDEADIRVFRLVGEIILGVLLRNQVEAALNNRLAVEELALELSTRFIEADPGQLIEMIKSSLVQVGRQGDFDIVHLVVYDLARQTTSLSYKWRCDQPDGNFEDLGILSFGSFSWADDRLRTPDPIILSRLSELSAEAKKERAYLEAEGIRSLIAIPIDVRDGYSAYLVLGALFSERIWNDWEVLLARRLGDIYSRALAHEYTARALEESERRYRQLFEESPVAMWEQDFSEMKRHLDSLKQEGNTDIRAYFESRPDEVLPCMGLIKSVKYNRLVDELLHTRKLEDLEKIGMEEFFTDAPSQRYVDQIVAVAEGAQFFENEVAFLVAVNIEKHVYFRWAVSPDLEEPYRRVIVTGIDITRRKQLEEQIRRQLALETMAAQFSAELIDIGIEEIDGAIYRILEEVGNFMGDDRVFLDLIEILWNPHHAVRVVSA